MLRRLLLICIALGLVGAGIVFALPVPKGPTRDFSGLTGDVPRGVSLARIGGCFACHTNSKDGGAVLAGGAAIKTPFGSFYGPNITMHKADGIGAWSIEDFSGAISDGVAPDGAHYFPAFPYAHYAAYSDQDIADLWAAFQTVPPVAGRAPAHDLMFPFNQRILAGRWKALFLEPVSVTPDPDRSDQWNRGRWLAEGPGHCAACHTPRNMLGAPKTSQPLAGGTMPDGERVPAITADALRASGWTRDDLVLGLRTALTPEGDALGGSMGEVVGGATRFWSAADLEAIAVYLTDDDTD